jgi:hypothetical protein
MIVEIDFVPCKPGNKNTRGCGAASLDRIVSMPERENEHIVLPPTCLIGSISY